MSKRWEIVMDAIKTQLESVSTVKNVRKGEERVTDPVLFEEYYTVASSTDATKRRVHAWVIIYNGCSLERTPHDLTTYMYEYRYEVHGFLNFIEPNDSDNELHDIVDDVLDVFGPCISLGLDANTVAPVTQSNIEVNKFDIDNFSDVICSHVKMTITVRVFHGGVHYT